MAALTPAMQTLVGRPCALCGGNEYSFFPKLTYGTAEEGKTGGAAHRFSVIVCRACHHATFFAYLAVLERSYPHTTVTAPASPPYR